MEIARGNENVLRICTYIYTDKYILLYTHTNKTVQTIKKGSELRKVLENMKICKNYTNQYVIVYTHISQMFRQWSKRHKYERYKKTRNLCTYVYIYTHTNSCITVHTHKLQKC